MGKDAADADRAAAEYWRRVARVDQNEARVAVNSARELTKAARREEREPGERQASGRTGRLRPGS